VTVNKVLAASEFAIPGILSIDENEDGLARAVIQTPECKAEIYLQGAHLSQWQPAGHENVLFLSKKSNYKPGKAIRGGVPIIFPWFGQRTAAITGQRTDGPAHGFARTSIWEIISATIDGADLHLKLGLGANDTARSLGWDNFELTYRLIIGKKLELLLTVENKSETTVVFEEAFHTYFRVGDAEKISIKGLGQTEYLDKTDLFKRKKQSEDLLFLTGETDRPYLNTEAAVYINDPVLNRRLAIEKKNSQTTVVWNPWAAEAEKIADLHKNGWKEMICIETANVGENAIHLEPGKKQTMQALITVQKD